jgi:4-diphosphocytidyl-2-C-methyl-D-erythritol kinase
VPDLTETVEAPAKLTLSLRVVGRREDGYHLLDAEMVTVGLTDSLQFRPGDGLSVSGPSAARVPSGRANLITAALEVMGRRVHVSLVKRIPVGAGLGGGSADAAAVLRWAGCRGLDVAARLGSDVPFCLVGGRGRVRGRGEVVDALPWEPMAGRTFTLLTPPFGVSTASVYRAWDDLGGLTGEGPNDLEPAALLIEPRLAEWRDRLGAAAGQTPVLAGSGSTWFVEGSYPGEGRVVVQAIRLEG